MGLICLASCGQASAQICTANTMYGLTGSGLIYPINMTTGVVGTVLNTTAPAGTSGANALSYNPLTQKFYFWAATYSSTTQTKCTGNPKVCTTTTTTTYPVFTSYDPATNTYQSLNTAGGPGFTTIRSGCATPDGKGYYCLNANGALYYYNVAGNSWAAIDSSWQNQATNTDMTADVVARTSGDMAMDASGNLWMLIAGTTNYGLFKVNAPLPTTFNASPMTMMQYYPVTTPNPDAQTIAGFAFSSTGDIYLASLADNMYKIDGGAVPTTPTATFTTTGVGNDLTSCNFPTVVFPTYTVLPVRFSNFIAAKSVHNKLVLTWQVAQEANTKTYRIEHSTDNKNWETVGKVESNKKIGSVTYTYNHYNAVGNQHYYRIVAVETDGHMFYSEVKMISDKTAVIVSLWPNPTKSTININNYENEFLKAEVFYSSGAKVIDKLLQPGVTAIDINTLPKGNYMVLVQGANGLNHYLKFVKE